jgi:hypothetical protein
LQLRHVPLSPLRHLVRTLYTCLIVVTLSFLFCFKLVRIFRGTAKLFVMSITFFFSSALSLPARRCLDNFYSKSWLCIPQSIASHQSFVSLSKKPFNLNGQLHFLEPMPSRFCFFLVLGGLYIPLLSHCIVKYDLFKTDLSIQTVNSPCRRTQPSNSSRSLHLAFVVKNEVVSQTLQTTPIGTGLGSSILPMRA